MIRWLVLGMWLMIVASCSSINGESTPGQIFKSAAVTGTVTYRERMALTPEAVVEVKLLDVSVADAAAIVISEQIIKPKHQVPIPFELSYDPADIDERMTYAVRAMIRERGRLMFTTDRSYRVLTRGNPGHVDLVLIRTTD